MCRGHARLSSLALADRFGNEAVRPMPSPIATHPLHYFIPSSTITIYHVSDVSYKRTFKFLTLPGYL